MQKSGLFLIGILIFIYNIVLGGEPKFFQIDASLGLTNLQITSITQDKNGFLWIGSKNGLFRYDGYKFIAYKNKIDDSSSISNNLINFVFVDSKNRLWIATNNGLNLFNHSKANFCRIMPNKENPTMLPNKLIETIYEDRQGNIWIGHYDGVSLINNSDIERNRFSFKNIRFVNKSSNQNWISNICEEDSTNIWFGAQFRGIYRYNTNTGSFKNYYNAQTMPFEYKITKIIRTKEREMLFSSFGSKLYTYNASVDSFHNTHEQVNIVRGITDVIQDSEGKIWIATDKGLGVVSENHSIKYFYHSTSGESGLSSNITTSLYEDRSGLIWIGTDGSGIGYLSKPSIAIKKLNKSAYPDMPVNIIKNIAYVNSALYFTSQYIGFFEFKNDKLNLINRQYAFSFNGFNKLFFDSEYYDLYKKSYCKIKKKVKDDRFFFTTNGNLICVNRLTLKIFDETSQSIDKSITTISPENNLHGFIQVHHVGKDSFLLLDNLGLFLMVDTSGKIKKLLDAKDIPGNNYHFNGLHVNGNNIWITSEHSLIHYRLNEGLIKTYNQDKQYGDMIFSLITDKDNDVWFTSNKGIVMLNPKQNKLYLFDKSDGLHTTIFSSGVTVSPDNTVFFGTGDGIIIIDKKTFSPNDYKPPLVFTAFTILNQQANASLTKVLATGINELPVIELAYNQNYFSIEYAGLNYCLSEKNQYAYYLKGLENSWNYVGKERKATYNGLPPGKYEFCLTASNNDGVWNLKEKILKIIIHPPFWKTIWFRLLLLLFIIGLLIFIFTQRIRSLKNKKKELELLVRQRTAEIVSQKEEIQTQADTLREVNLILNESHEELKTQADIISTANEDLLKLNSTKDKFFSIIAHDLKNPFQAINGLTEMLLNGFDTFDKGSAKEYLAHILASSKSASGLLENLLEWARSQSNKIKFEPETISMFNISAETIELLNVNAKNKDLTLINHVSKELTSYADKNMVTTILRNLLNNAIKFTPSGGKVIVSGNATDEYAEIVLEDTGVGMDEKTIQKLFRIDQHVTTSGTSGESGTGLGLIITKEFIEKNNGSIKVESELGKGSKFIIHLPINKNNSITSPYAIDDSIQIPEENYNEIEIQKTAIASDTNNPSDKPLVLLAEDTYEIRIGIKAALENNYRIVEAGDGEEALKYALELIPDLVITDWMMPKMEGIELCEKLKTNMLTSHIPVIMLTAKSNNVSKIQGFDTGADDYMTKPFDNSILIARVKNLIISRIELQKKYSSQVDTEEEKIEINSVDKAFMDKLINLIEKNIDNSDFNINEICNEIGMSRSQLYRKITALTGQSPVNYLRNFRLKKAADMIQNTNESISQIMFRVGFSNTSYFARSFKEVYGCSPKEFLKK